MGALEKRNRGISVFYSFACSGQAERKIKEDLREEFRIFHLRDSYSPSHHAPPLHGRPDVNLFFFLSPRARIKYSPDLLIVNLETAGIYL